MRIEFAKKRPNPKTTFVYKLTLADMIEERASSGEGGRLEDMDAELNYLREVTAWLIELLIEKDVMKLSELDKIMGPCNDPFWREQFDMKVAKEEE